jgi:hypothetical protein
LLAATDGSATLTGRFLSARVAKRVRHLLAEPEPQALQRLADEVMWGESVPAQLDIVRNLTGTRLRESHDWHWEAIADERVTGPLSDRVYFALSGRPGCPPWFRARFDSRSEIGDGRIGWGDLFANAQAAYAMSCLSKASGESAAEGLEVLRAIVSSTVDGRPEAWVLAIQMLETFEGSVCDLLRTAAAATD